MTTVPTPPNSFPQALQENVTETQAFSPEEELAKAGEVIATTPVAGNKSVVDIQEFQVSLALKQIVFV